MSLKRHQKLTPSHFELSPSSLLRNRLATDVLNKDMLRLIEVIKIFNLLVLSRELLQQDHEIYMSSHIINTNLLDKIRP